MLAVFDLYEAELKRPSGRRADVNEIGAACEFALFLRHVHDGGVISNLVHRDQHAPLKAEPRDMLAVSFDAIGVHDRERDQFAGPSAAVSETDRQPTAQRLEMTDQEAAVALAAAQAHVAQCFVD